MTSWRATSGCLLLLAGCTSSAPVQTASVVAPPAPIQQAAFVDGAPQPFAPPFAPMAPPPVAGYADGPRFTAAEEPIAAGVRQGPAPPPRRLDLPPELPGAGAPPIRLPRFDPQNPAAREQAITQLFPELPPLGAEAQAAAARPLALADLQQIAHDHSPLIRQAMADIRAAQGTALQAGLYPNPTAGYEADNIGTGNTAGYQGAFFEQLIKTAGKLQLARASALVDVANAEVAFKRADVDLTHQVRTNYFAVLVAQENVKVSRALAKFTDEAYRVQVDMTKGGQAAAYEPMQLRVLAYQARGNLIQARNRYIAGWKQLAASMGVPGLPPTPLVGSVDASVPLVRFDAALVHVLNTHTDVITAENNIRRARLNVQLAYANRIPDISTHVAVQKDNTTPPFGEATNIAVSIPVPVFDRNQGNIEQSEGALANAMEGPHQARDDLTNRLTDAFERYDDNRQLVEYYSQHILPDQVQAYRGAYDRHQQDPDVAFADVVTAQQTLAGTVTTYVGVLGSLWTAVSDLGALLQADDLFRMGELQPVSAVPDLETIRPLPCCHGTPLWQNPSVRAGDGNWPAAAPEPLPAGRQPR